MDIDALRDLSVQDLFDKEETLRKELFNLRFQAATGHIENPNRFKGVRRDIARILTVIQVKKHKVKSSPL